MVNVNISIKEEAYNFLRKLKTANKSFSDVILEFKETKGNRKNVKRFFGGLKKEESDKIEKNMKGFREEFDSR